MGLLGEWCHACGQGHRHVRLSLARLAGDLFEELASADTRLIRTVRTLTRNPGRVCREYLHGGRMPWTNPIKYALLTATIAFLVQRWVVDLAAAPDSVADARMRDFQLDYGLIVNFLVMPLWAGLTRLLFWGARLRWVEHFVLAAYGFGHLFFLQTCLFPLARLGSLGEAIMGVLAFLLPVPFLAWLAVDLLGASWWSALLRILVGWVGMQLILGLGFAWIFLS